MKYVVLLIWLFVFAFMEKCRVLPGVSPYAGLYYADSLQKAAASLLNGAVKINGYRYCVTGNFDSCQGLDTLIERYTDSLGMSEMPKYYYFSDTTDNYSEGLWLNEYLGCKSSLSWESRNLSIEGGSLGFHYIENCGDLNGDKQDEILLVRQWADYSSLNHADIYTFQNNKWHKVFTIPVWEWQFPETPQASMLPTLFGDFTMQVCHQDSLNNVLEIELHKFRFIEHISDTSIEYISQNPFELSESDQNFIDAAGEHSYLMKQFIPVKYRNSVYLFLKQNKAICYKASEIETEHGMLQLMLGIDDRANTFTTRIFLNHPQNPFRINSY